MTVTWTLRPDLKWSDGEPLTCDDFKYAWEWVLDEENVGVVTTGYTDIGVRTGGLWVTVVGRSPGDGWVASGPGVVPGVASTSPESGSIWDAPSRIMQATWTSPISNRVLLESGYSSFWTRHGDIRPFGALTDFISVTEQSTAAGTPRANFIYRGWNAARIASIGAIATELGLIATGGSDYHGDMRPDRGMPGGKHNVICPPEVLDQLRDAAASLSRN